MSKPTKAEELYTDEASRQLDMAERYVSVLSGISGVKVRTGKSGDGIEWAFSPSKANALKVTLEYEKNFQGQAFTSLRIQGVDCGYWHTAEEKNLDFHLNLAKAALLGDVAYNRSPIFKFREVCFLVDESWMCTRVDNMSSYHYITHRKKLKGSKR